MNSDREFFDFCNKAIFFDYKNQECIDEFNQIRKIIINRFHETIPHSRILYVLSVIDDIILNIFSNEIDNILKDIHNLRENIIYMLSFEKTVNDEEN